jgi:hypothetical protein
MVAAVIVPSTGLCFAAMAARNIHFRWVFGSGVVTVPIVPDRLRSGSGTAGCGTRTDRRFRMNGHRTFTGFFQTGFGLVVTTDSQAQNSSAKQGESRRHSLSIVE